MCLFPSLHLATRGSGGKRANKRHKRISRLKKTLMSLVGDKDAFANAINKNGKRLPPEGWKLQQQGGLKM